MELVFIPVLLVLIGAVIYGAVLANRKKRERIEGLARWAAQNGLSFAQAEQSALDGRFPSYACLQEGENRYAYNVTEGIWRGHPLCAFDYHFETYSTDSKGRRHTHHHYFSAVVLKSPCVLKPLFIRPESFFDKVTEFFGFDDIDFESTEFSRSFYVKAKDKRWAYDVLHQRTMEFLLASPRYSIEFGTWDAILWQSDTFPDAAAFEQAASVLQGIFDRFPEYLRKQQLEG